MTAVNEEPQALLDRFERRSGDWRIAHRLMRYDWHHDFGMTIDRSRGVMGLPLSAEHFSGRAVGVGDYSETLFGKARP